MATESENRNVVIDAYLNLLRIQAAGNEGWQAEVQTQLAAMRVKLEAMGVVVEKLQIFK